MKAFFTGLALMALLVFASGWVYTLAEQPSGQPSPNVHVDLASKSMSY